MNTEHLQNVEIAFQKANLEELRRQNADLLKQNESLKAKLDAYPGRMLLHAIKAVGREKARHAEVRDSLVVALQTALRHAREAMPHEERQNFDGGKNGPEWMFVVQSALAKVGGE